MLQSESENYITETKRNQREEEGDSSINKLFQANYNPITNRYGEIFFKKNTKRPEIILEKDEEDDKSEVSRGGKIELLNKDNAVDNNNQSVAYKITRKKANEKKRAKEMTNFLTLILAKKTKFTIKMVDFIIFLLICGNIFCSVTENNIFTSSEIEVNGKMIKQQYYLSDSVITLRYVCIVLVILMDILITVRYYLNLKLLRHKNLACSQDGLIFTGLWKYYLMEVIVLSIFCPPETESVFTGRMLGGYYVYSVSSICNFLVVFKLYYIVRIYTNMSIFLSERSYLIGLQNKLVISMPFAVKSQLKKYPYLSIILVFLISVGIFGLTLRTFEYGYIPDKQVVEGQPDSGRAVINADFEAYLDSFWMIVITMMTVGFGDISPKTHMGRVIAFLSCIVGMFLVSWLILSMSTLIEFTPEENKALCLLKVQEVREDLEAKAANVIKSVSNMYLLKKNFQTKNVRRSIKKSTSTTNIGLFLTELFILRGHQVNFLKQLKVSQTVSLPSDDILKNLKNKFSDDVKVIQKNKVNVVCIKNLTLSMIKEEEEIFQGMKNIKHLQDSLSSFLVNFNNKQNKIKKKSS